MNTYLVNLVNLQTSILYNYVLSQLISFFYTEESSLFLYDTISITKDVTKKEMKAEGKKPPTTKKYAVYVEKNASKLLFLLRTEGYSDIEIYNITLINDKPNVKWLKTIVKAVAGRYRPIPTTIDKSFSVLAKEYSDYLVYYQVKRSWQNGYFPRFPEKKPRTGSKSIANASYKDFLNEVTLLANTYRAFCKILIDIYQGKVPTKYISENRIYILDVGYSKEYGISLMVENLPENHGTHEVIKIDSFTPEFFSDKKDFVRGVTAAVSPSFSRT